MVEDDDDESKQFDGRDLIFLCMAENEQLKIEEFWKVCCHVLYFCGIHNIFNFVLIRQF